VINWVHSPWQSDQVEQQGNYYRNKVATWRVVSISKILDCNIFQQPLRPVISIFEFLTNTNTVTVKKKCAIWSNTFACLYKNKAIV
jgi:hypothetical protein